MFGRSLNKYTSNERKPVRIFPWVDKKNTKSPSCHKWNSFFWNISFDVFTSDLAPSRMIFGKRWPFLVTKSSTFEGSKKALLFCHNGIFRVYHICNGTCPQEAKKIEASTHCCFWKTNLKMTVERRQNHLRQSQLIFQKTFRTLHKNEEISKVVYFFLFGLKLKMKLVETVSVTIDVKFRQTSYASKTN